MQDVLLSIHTCSSTTSNTLSQLTEKVTASYSAVDSHDDRMYKLRAKNHFSGLYGLYFYLQKKLTQ